MSRSLSNRTIDVTPAEMDEYLPIGCTCRISVPSCCQKEALAGPRLTHQAGRAGDRVKIAAGGNPPANRSWESIATMWKINAGEIWKTFSKNRSAAGPESTMRSTCGFSTRFFPTTGLQEVHRRCSLAAEHSILSRKPGRQARLGRYG